MWFTEENTFTCTPVLFIRRSVKYGILRFATTRRPVGRSAACRYAIRGIRQTNAPNHPESTWIIYVGARIALIGTRVFRIRWNPDGISMRSPPKPFEKHNV